MRRYLYETRIIIGAMPAANADSLRARHAALGVLAPLASAHGHLPVMLKAALHEDLCRQERKPPPRAAWFGSA